MDGGDESDLRIVPPIASSSGVRNGKGIEYVSGIGIWVALAAVGLASCAQGLTGFGFSVVAVPLLLLVFPPSTVIVIALLLSLVLTVTLLPRAEGEIQPLRTWPLFAFSLAG